MNKFKERLKEDKEYIQLILNEALNEFQSNATNKYEKDLKVTGFIVVGSFVNNDHIENESDLDIYVTLNKEYSESDGFRRYLRQDPYYSKQLNNSIPEIFTSLDIIEVDSETNIISKCRDPYHKYINYMFIKI